MPFLSIIIPVYNKGAYLDKCLTSIAEQSYTDWEVILVNDGSTDSSATICDKWQQRDARFKVHHQQNSGVSTARNNGLQLAEGVYVQFTDADDWWDTGSFQAIYDELSELKCPDILIHGMTKVSHSGEQIAYMPSARGLKTKKAFFMTLIGEQKRTGVYGGVSNKWTLRKLIESNKLRFNPKYNLLEDYDFFLSVFESCNCIALSQHHGYFYLQGADNSSTSAGFRFYYPHVMAIRMKSYHLVMATCGVTDEDKEIVKKELEDLYLGMFVEQEQPTYSKLKELDKEVLQLINGEIKLRPKGSSFNTRVISYLLNLHALWALYFYLNFRKIISHA